MFIHTQIYPLANLLGPWELIVLAFLGILLFGKRLPEMGRSLGQGIVEFKKGLGSIEQDINQAGQPRQPTTSIQHPSSSLSPEYKFDPYTGKPLNPDPPATPVMRFDPYTGKPLGDPGASSNPPHA
jgi:sec-independent protein translocase protein TatA